jgi:O-Antigen ligase
VTRRAVLAVAGACLLAGPTVLAFFSGGYFAHPRLVAAIVVWLLVLALAVTGPAPLPRTLPGRLAVGGLAALTGWSALSILWAPQAGPAMQNVQRLVLYTGALLLALGVLRHPRAQRAVEPALAAGAAIVIGYGLSGRILPGLIHLDRSQSAGGRLEQPLTYWNAEGALAAMGLVLCARLAGDRSRPPAIRLAAAAAAPVVAAGVYLSYSRGALAVAALGLLVLVAAAPSRSQIRAAALVLGGGIVVGAVSELLPGVSELAGSHPERDGAIFLATLVATGAATAYGVARGSSEPSASPRWYGSLGRVAWIATGVVVAGLIVGGLAERPSDRELSAAAGARRLTTVTSNRYEYWRVALTAFRDEPLVGVGSGGFRVVWLQERPIAETVRDTHSLAFEIAAELGLVGLLALALMAGGTAVAARRALARDGAPASGRAPAAGAAAALVAWALHASIDWDWQMPAVTLPAIVLAGLLIAVAEAEAGDRR